MQFTSRIFHEGCMLTSFQIFAVCDDFSYNLEVIPFNNYNVC